MFKRHEGKHHCSGDQSDCNFVCSLKAVSFQCQKVRTTKDGLKKKGSLKTLTSIQKLKVNMKLRGIDRVEEKRQDNLNT